MSNQSFRRDDRSTNHSCLAWEAKEITMQNVEGCGRRAEQLNTLLVSHDHEILLIGETFGRRDRGTSGEET